MKKYPFYQVDAFTDKLFGGNPAAVCPLNTWLPDHTMQKLAEENNLSETAFFIKKGAEYEIRWFTPVAEIDLAGHPTLAAAHVLFTELNETNKEITFNSKSGKLVVKKSTDGYVMNFPSRMPVETRPHYELTEALGAESEPIEVLESRDLFVVYSDQESIEKLTPDFNTIENVHPHAVIVTAPGNNCDFVSRFFAPAIGINEDPVTGSAHASLIPYWAKKLQKNKLSAMQLSKRKGVIKGEYLGERVTIAGNAITYMIGEYNLYE